MTRCVFRDIITAELILEGNYGLRKAKNKEYFFDLCKKRGLTGEQGVIIPISNVKDLVLKEEVIEYCNKTAKEHINEKNTTKK